MNIDIKFKHNIFTDEIIEQEPYEKYYKPDTNSYGGDIYAGDNIQNNIQRAKHILKDRETIPNLENSILKSNIDGMKNFKKSNQELKKGATLENDLQIKDHEIEEIKEQLSHKDYIIEKMKGIYNKYSGEQQINKELKKLINEENERTQIKYNIGALTNDVIAGSKLIENDKKKKVVNAIFEDPSKDESSSFELEKNNFVDVQPYKTQDERYMKSIPTPQAIAQEAKITLNLDDNEYNDLDKDDNINIKF